MNVRFNNLISATLFFLVGGAMMAGWREMCTFVKNAATQPRVVGAVLPSSPSVGKELIRYVVMSQKQNSTKPLRILEIGSGTGAMTEIIAKHVRPLDKLDLVEISHDFCQVLHTKYDACPQISINCTSILDWAPKYQYDFIISTLPFNSFEYKFVDTVINHLGKLIKRDGVISFVAYAGVSRLKTAFTFGKKRVDQKKKVSRILAWRSRYQIAEKMIFKNVPPLHVYHLQMS